LRSLSDNADQAQMDEAARQALAFSRYGLGGEPQRDTDNAEPPA
jgi:hypothetical protein